MTAKKLPAPEYRSRERKIPTGPLSPLMRDVLGVLAENEEWHGLTGNEIGLKLGFRQGDVKANVSGASKYSCVRSMGPAQKIIPVLVALDRREMVAPARRRDGRSGSAYRITTKGREAMGNDAGGTATVFRTDARKAANADMAVWVQEGYDTDELNLEPVARQALDWFPGDNVTIEDDHDDYGGETGIVKAAGTGTGTYAGSVVYDVLIDGTSDAERFTSGDLC